MGFVHYCAYCGVEREAETPTILEPTCSSCGCPLKACRKEHYARVAEALADEASPRRRRVDGTGPLAAVTAGPFLLPALGVEMSDIVFAVPFIFFLFAMFQCRSAARRPGASRSAWIAYSTAAGFGAAACALMVGADITERSRNGAFTVAAVGGAWVLIAVTIHLIKSVRGLRAERLLDVTQPLILVVAAGAFFVVEPGFRAGSDVLTAIFTCAE